MPTEVALKINKKRLLEQLSKYESYISIEAPLNTSSIQDVKTPEITADASIKSAKITKEDQKLRELLDSICNGKYSN